MIAVRVPTFLKGITYLFSLSTDREKMAAM
jgi:hypothetical protein